MRFKKIGLLIFVFAVVLGTSAAYACNNVDTNTECEHSYVLIEEVAATCTQDGKKTYECEKCKDKYTDTVTAYDHAWGEWQLVEAATCYKDGKEERVCSRCETTESRAVTERPDHNYEENIEERESPTCSSLGKKVFYCTNEGCTESYFESIPMLKHVPSGEGVIVKATCEEKGYTRYHCRLCGKDYDEDVTGPSEHTMQDYSEAATCEHGSATGKKCSECGYTELVRADDKKVHSFGENGVCSLCNKRYDEAQIFSLSEKAYTAVYEGGKWKFTANEEVLQNDKSFDFSIDKEAVNAYIAEGYNTIALTFRRKEANMATMFVHGVQSSNETITITLPLTKDEAAEIKDMYVQTIGTWVGIVDASGLEWINADGFELTVKAINYEKPECWFNEEAACVKVGEGSFDFSIAGGVDKTILKFSEEALDYLTGKGYDLIRITYYGKNGAAINMGLRLSKGGWLGWTDNKAPVSKEVEIGALKADPEIIAYYVAAEGTDGFNVTFEAINSITLYEDVEEWFNAETSYIKVSDNSFDFTKEGDGIVLSFKAEALAYLASKGYDAIRVTYVEKNPVAGTTDLGFYRDGETWRDSVFTGGVAAESRIFEFTGEAFSIYCAKAKVTEFNIVFEAVKTAES